MLLGFSFLLLYLFIVCVCTPMLAHRCVSGTHVEVGGQLAGVCSLLLPFGSRELKSCYQTWWWAPLPPEPWCWSLEFSEGRFWGMTQCLIIDLFIFSVSSVCVHMCCWVAGISPSFRCAHHVLCCWVTTHSAGFELLLCSLCVPRNLSTSPGPPNCFL